MTSRLARHRRLPRRVSARRLLVETLEDRRLLSVDLIGQNNWLSQGPSPIVNGETDNISSTGPGNNPVVGAIHAVAAHPTDADTLYVGSVGGGVWRSENATTLNPNWTALTDQFPGIGITALEFDPTDATNRTLYAGVGRASSFGIRGPLTGLLRSTDGGDTWSQLGVADLTGRNISGIIARGNTILVSASNNFGATGGGVYRSTDGGQNFNLISGQGDLDAGAAFDLVADPGDLDRAYVSVGGVGIFRTDNLTVAAPAVPDWFDISNGDASLDGVITGGGNNNLEMAVSPTNGRVYAAVVVTGQLSYMGFSDNQGGTWTEMDLPITNDGGSSIGLHPRPKPGGQGGIHLSVIVDPNVATTVYVGGDRQPGGFPNSIGALDFTGRLFRGDTTVAPVAPGSQTNNFSPQWEHLTSTQNLGFAGGGTASNSSPHADSREMVFNVVGELIEVDDGGIYRRTSPADNTGDWFSLMGNGAGGLQVAEAHNVVYDNNSDVIIIGDQDTGTAQQTDPGNLVYTQTPMNPQDGNFPTPFFTFDGGDVVVDNRIGGGQSLRYVSSQNLGNFRRQIYDANNNLVSQAQPSLTGFGGDAQFVTPLAVNEVAANRLVIGGSSNVYESTDNGDNLNVVSTNGANGNAIAYGGSQNDVPNPNALFVGSGTQVLGRTGPGNLAPTSGLPFGTGGAGNVADVEMNPDNFNTVVAIDNNQVFLTANAGGLWNDLTGNLVDNTLRTIEYIVNPLVGGPDAILVGGVGGVFRMLTDAVGVWEEFATGLPNSLVFDMDYDAPDDILVVSTMGRGVFALDSLSELVFGDDQRSLQVCGDDDHPNQDDLIELVRNETNPAYLDVVINEIQFGPYELALLDQINVFGVGGNDTLSVDSSFGLINVPDGIRYDGDGACPASHPGFGYDRGFDTLTLDQSGGDTQTTDVYSVGPAAGSGSSVITGPSGTQTIFFEELEPVIDLVPALDLTVNGTNEANLINYATGASGATGKVIIDAYEPIEFGQKSTLTLRAGLGDDAIVLDNALTPTGLTGITVFGDSGNDSIVNRQAAILPQTLNGGPGDDYLVGGPDTNTVIGGSGFDTIGVEGTPDDNVIDLLQDNGTTLTSVIDGDTRTDSFSTVEAVSLNAGDGDDTIRVGHDDSLVAAAANSLPIHVVGDDPNASDRLAVRDEGIGDTVIYRVGADQRSGTVTVGPLATISFTQIEYVDVTPLDAVTGGTGSDGNGRMVVFKPDRFENNNTRTSATFLGAGSFINVDPVIDPGAFAPLGLASDQDWFELIALETGVLDVQAEFEQVGTLSNGRAGLPGDGNLELAVYDATGDLIATSNSNTDDERVTIAAVRNETYFVRVTASGEAVNIYNLAMINLPAPVPFVTDLQATSDSGRSDTDDITNDTSPTFDVYLDDDRLEEFANLDLVPDDDFFVDVFNNGVLLGTAVYQGPGGGVADNSRWSFTASPGDLQEGHNNFITAAVRMQDEATPRVDGRGEFSDSLQVTLDTIAPTGTANLFPDSDSGIWGFPETMDDLITSDMTPLLYGATEANALVRASIDDTPAGTAVAVPYDGDEAFPPPSEFDGNYFLQTILNLDDGAHTIELFFRDVAGNESPSDEDATLEILIDTQGPKITNVTRGVVSTDNVFSIDGVTSVFEPKPSETGPDPLVHSIFIHFSDLPDRTADFADADALFLALAEEEGNYSIRGDHNGYITIVDVNVTLNTVPDDGLAETAEVELIFDQALPDDRYTLWVSDSIADPAGNPIDGESGALGPFDGNDVPNETPPIFPTGDGEHGGDFSGRFTIDSRPEIGTFALGTTYVDINGNFIFDSEGKDRDYTNRDITFQFGLRDDRVFSGNFAAANAASSTGYDKLGSYGVVGGQGGGAWFWRLDFNHDGVIDFEVLSGKQIAGEPAAGDFDPTHPGDEIGLFDGNKWFLDTTGNNNIGDPGDLQLQGNMRGFPIVGDFDGDGLDDLGTWNPGNQGLQTQGRFEFDLAANGLSSDIEQVIEFDLAGVFERPVAADMNADGIDDLGLFVTRREGVPPAESAEWFFLISDAGAGEVTPGQVTALDHAFTPVPFGTDLFTQFGDENALPVVGNFDPPSGDLPDPLDTNLDGSVTALDALLVINAMSRLDSAEALAPATGAYDYHLDTTRDGEITARDALLVINRLGQQQVVAEAEPLAADQASAVQAAGVAVMSESDNDDDELLLLLATDQASLRSLDGP